MSLTQGKALLVIRRTHAVGDDRHPNYEVTAFIQSCDGDEWAMDAAHENFDLLTYDTLPVPNAARKLKEPGDQVRVYVVYQFHYIRGDWGWSDDDIELHYLKERVRRWQPWSRNPQRKKVGPE